MLVEHQDIERKVCSILRVLSESSEPVGARIIARQIRGYGIDLTERAVRYHLKLMDERGLTRCLGRDGRLITERGLEEIKSALVADKVGFIIAKIELLAFRTTFDPEKLTGQVVVNTSLYPKARFKKALLAMKDAFKTGLCVSPLVAVAEEGQRLGDMLVPPGRVGFATLCSVTINGTLLKAGVPMDSRFGGILQLKGSRPVRFVDLINYDGSSLDPSEAFIRARMTSVGEAARYGEGKIVANFREVPALCRPLAEKVLGKLENAGIKGLVVMGRPGEAVCEIQVGLNRVGIVLLGGLNPVAAADEAGVPAESRAMSTLIDYRQMVSYWDLLS